MSGSILILVALLCSFCFNTTSFLRTLILLESVLLTAGLFLVTSTPFLQTPSCSHLFSALILLTLAGTEAAVGLSIVVFISL